MLFLVQALIWAAVVIGVEVFLWRRNKVELDELWARLEDVEQDLAAVEAVVFEPEEAENP